MYAKQVDEEQTSLGMAECDLFKPCMFDDKGISSTQSRNNPVREVLLLRTCIKQARGK